MNISNRLYNMKNKILFLFFAFIVFFHCISFAETGDPAIDTLIKKMEEKGIIEKNEAQKLEEEVKKAVKERDKRIAKDIKLPFEIKMRFQPRFDYGDLLINDNNKYATESDLYMRRIRLTVSKDFEKPPFGKKIWTSITLDADKFEMDFDKGARKDPDKKININTLEAGWAFLDEFGLYFGYDIPPYYRNTSSGKQLTLDSLPNIISASDKITGGYQVHLRLFGQFFEGIVKYMLAYGDGANSLSKLKDIDSAATAVRKKSWGDFYSARIEFAPPGLVEKGWDDTNMAKENFLALGIGTAVSGKKRYTAGAGNPDVNVKTSIFNIDLSGRYRFGEASITGSGGYMTLNKNYSYKKDESPKGYYIQAGFLFPGKILFGQFEPVARYDVYDSDKAGANKTKEKALILGFNHYFSKHNLKWGYNYVQTKYDKDVRVAANDSTRRVHQVQFQYEF
ncbi:MAG: OprO/OprP family phosphate-selective porin [Syntrophorhabdaceae bacterium]|nr:OprO/OprP family phosphate-selective porin [Syntrophorhabdaceae bacterium]